MSRFYKKIGIIKFMKYIVMIIVLLFTSCSPLTPIVNQEQQNQQSGLYKYDRAIMDYEYNSIKK
jgi:hypothetical protein